MSGAWRSNGVAGLDVAIMYTIHRRSPFYLTWWNGMNVCVTWTITWTHHKSFDTLTKVWLIRMWRTPLQFTIYLTQQQSGRANSRSTTSEWLPDALSNKVVARYPGWVHRQFTDERLLNVVDVKTTCRLPDSMHCIVELLINRRTYYASGRRRPPPNQMIISNCLSITWTHHKSNGLITRAVGGARLSLNWSGCLSVRIRLTSNYYASVRRRAPLRYMDWLECALTVCSTTFTKKNCRNHYAASGRRRLPLNQMIISNCLSLWV